jgi:hypothetical protein
MHGNIETEREILAGAEAAGHNVSGWTLRRFYRAGLLQRPTQLHPAGEPGSKTSYPDGTANQLLAICKKRKEYRSFHRVGWLLWWDDFNVDRKYWRRRLEIDAAWYDIESPKIAKAIYPHSDDEIADRAFRLFQKLRNATTRINRALFRQVRKRVRDSDWDTFMAMLFAIQTGRFEELRRSQNSIDSAEFDRDTSILRRGLGFHHRASRVQYANIDEPLAALSKTLKGLRLSDVLAETSDRELIEARDEIRGIFAIVQVAKHFDELFGKYAFGFTVLAEFAQRMPEREINLMLLIWLALRKNSEMQPNVKLLLHALPYAASFKQGYEKLDSRQRTAFANIFTVDRLVLASQNQDEMQRLISEVQKNINSV